MCFDKSILFLVKLECILGSEPIGRVLLPTY